MQRFDQITKIFAERRLNRRTAIAAGALAGVTAANGANAQTATPEPGDPFGGTKSTMFLFVQSFQAGRLEPIERGAGPYRLTLSAGLGQTIFFSDRPERITGAMPTADFLDRLGFSPANPPNAALVAEKEDGAGDEEILIIELVNPVYDADSREVSYDVRILDESERVGMTFLNNHHTGKHDGSTYGVSHLFIDDCATQMISCALPDSYEWTGDLGGPLFCWDAEAGCCAPCYAQGAEFWNGQCNQTFSACNGGCTAYVANGGWCDGGPGGPTPACETHMISCAAPNTYEWVGDWGGPLFCVTEEGCCAPCESSDQSFWDDTCNQAFPDACQEGCTAYVANGSGCDGGPGFRP